MQNGISQVNDEKYSDEHWAMRVDDDGPHRVEVGNFTSRTIEASNKHNKGCNGGSRAHSCLTRRPDEHPLGHFLRRVPGVSWALSTKVEYMVRSKPSVV